MIKKILLLTLLSLFLNADENLTAQKQNALYVQNLIEIEEKMAKMFEKYLLTEFKIPTLENLRTDDYLGENFSVTNMMGNNIDFQNTSELKLKYAIAKDEFRNKKLANGEENYIVQLYNRDLYRENTSVSYDVNTFTNSYVEIILKSAEARTIFELLKAGNTIQKNCLAASLVNTYCNNNEKTIRWHYTNERWIEYDKKDFNNANVTVSLSSMNSDSKMSALAIGSYILVKDGSRYVKLKDQNGALQILKVD